MSKRVLLYVEDEDAAAFLMEAALREVGIPVEFFRVDNGEQALAFLRQSGTFAKAPPPDLVLLDLNLPKMDGFQVLEAMRKEAALAAIPVTVFTSSAQLSDKTRALALGARDFITKPANLDDFFLTIENACSQLRQ
jgi:two-component system, chemotaxis family, response regulator Rcp1